MRIILHTTAGMRICFFVSTAHLTLTSQFVCVLYCSAIMTVSFTIVTQDAERNREKKSEFNLISSINHVSAYNDVSLFYSSHELPWIIRGYSLVSMNIWYVSCSDYHWFVVFFLTLDNISQTIARKYSRLLMLSQHWLQTVRDGNMRPILATVIRQSRMVNDFWSICIWMGNTRNITMHLQLLHF